MDCSKCLSKCKAHCCGMVPIPIQTFITSPPSRSIHNYNPIENMVFATDKEGYCVYLTKDYKCSIYHKRPDVCKRYGDESHSMLVCPYMSKDDVIRTRAERKRLMREKNKQSNSILKNLHKTNYLLIL